MKRIVVLSCALLFTVISSRATQLNDQWFQTVDSSYVKGLANLASEHEKAVASLLDRLKRNAWTPEAFAVRDYLIQFRASRDISPSDVVQTPRDLRALQLAYIKQKQNLGDQILVLCPKSNRHK